MAARANALRSALHQIADLLADALEEERDPSPPPPKGKRTGPGLAKARPRGPRKPYVPDGPVSDIAKARADAALRRLGMHPGMR